jgi:hypothetical protein
MSIGRSEAGTFMLLRRRLLFLRSLPLPLRAKPTVEDRGKTHACGLRHRFSCESWSWTTAIMWWALRNDR